jgi:septal ring-binding cell division protein DamX
MPDDTLEEVRLLSNLESNRHKLLQIVLFGQPELDQHLDTAGMRQLKERIIHSFELEPLVRGDIENYIDFRMRAAGYRGPKVFTPEAIKLITRASEGLTRRINILADKALLAAFASGTHAVTAAEVKKAVRDSEFYRARSGAQKIRLGAAALAAGLGIGWATHLLLGAASPQPQPARAAPPPMSMRSDSGTVPVTSAIAPAPGTAVAVVPLRAPAPVPDAAPASASSRAEPGRIVTQAAASPEPPESTAAPAISSAPVSMDVSSKQPPAPAQGKLARERFEATQEWLGSAPGDRYAIQLATVNAGELPQLEDFLRKAAAVLPINDLMVYSVKIEGQQHYRVAYGSYRSALEAFEAIKGLPQPLAAYQPYTRSIERMRSQNRQ